MKRTVALTLILVVLLLGAFSSSAGARDAAQVNPADQFLTLALGAARPASGLEMYENIHEYMWKPVYVMGIRSILPCRRTRTASLFLSALGWAKATFLPVR